jgi:pyrophosphatase PpaX
MINTVLFDFDGTLVDTNAVIIESWQHTFRTLEGKERPLEDIIKTLGEPLVVTMAKLFPHMDTSETIPIYRDFQRDNFIENVSLFPGMGELVVTLKRKGYKLGLVTSRMKRSTTLGLEKFKLKEYFDVIITADDTDKHKPDPEPVNIALEKLDSKAEESILIGDSRFDILCAKNAGVKSILVAWSIAFPEEVPDYIIKTAEEVFQILDKYNA